jgi:hypothetical protein
MGHQVCYCSLCNRPVMEGHNDWQCDCGAYMGYSTQWEWKVVKKKEKKKKNKKKYYKFPIV